jgi:hypothetical protein
VSGRRPVCTRSVGRHRAGPIPWCRQKYTVNGLTYESQFHTITIIKLTRTMVMDSALCISLTDYRSMPPVLREAIKAWLDGKALPESDSVGTAAALAPPSIEPTAPPASGSGAADLSGTQANQFLEGCSDKTKKLLRIVLSEREPKFYLADIAKKMGAAHSNELAGAWSGITRRTRNVLGDRDADFVVWTWDDTREDTVGHISDTTFHSMRAALQIG